MTVSAQTPINRSTGNGATTVFPYTFKIIAEADIEVSVDDVVKTLNVDYTVSGVGSDAGGNVTMTTAPASLTTVVRRRDMALVRTTDYQDQGELPAATLDQDLDSVVLMVQQVDEQIGRAIKFSGAISGFDNMLPFPTPNYYLRVKSAGDGLEFVTMVTPGALTMTPFGEALFNSSDAATARASLVAAQSGANADITSMMGQTFNKNILINGGFTVNQRAYVSAAVLASGSFGHDRWKAGASGGNYTFTQLASNTQITIASGKSLIQVVEDKNVQATRYVLSWSGTAQARVGVNSSTPSGSYASSPIVITGQTAGSVMSVEFGPGTLGEVQCETTTGSLSTPFERRPHGVELALCERYARPFPGFVAGQAYTTSAAFYSFSTGTTMRATPTASAGTYQTSNAAATGITGTLAVTSMVGNTIRFDMTAVTGSPLIAGNASVLSAPAGSMLTAEL